MKKVYLLLLLSLANIAVFGQVLNSESFDGTTFPPSGWVATTGSYPWSRATSGSNPTCSTHSGAGMAYVQDYNSSATVKLTTPVIDLSNVGSNTPTVTVWFYRDVSAYNSSGYNGEGTTLYINTSNSTTGATTLGYVPRRGGQATSGSYISGTSTTTTSGWFQYTFTIPSTFNTATNYLIFSNVGKAGDNQYMDDVTWQSYPPTCNGAPSAGTASAGITTGCSTFSTTLSLSGTSTGIGITYQWQSSANNVTFTPISGATNSTYAATVSSATYYDCIISCTSSSLSATTNVVYCNIVGTSYASLPFTESFETPWGSCSATDDRPNQYWTNVNPATGNNSWRRDDDGTSANWTSPTYGVYSPTSSAGTHSARYHSYFSNGTTGTLDLHVDMSSSTYSKMLSFDYLQEDVGYPNTNLSVLVSTDGGSTFPTTLISLGQNVQSWTTYTMTTTSTSATTVIRFFATGGYGNYDIGLDNINVISLAPTLSVSPTALSYGNVGVSSYSPSQSFSLSGTNLAGYPGSVTVTAPSNFQVSSDNSSWGGTASISYTAATLAATPVYVRFNPAAAIAYSDYVTAAVAGATTASVSVTGTGALPCSVPSDQPSAINFSGTVNTSTTATLTDAIAPTGYVLVSSIGAFTGTMVNGTAYTVGTVIGNGTVVGTSTTTTVNVTGLTPNATNTITVFPYSLSGTCAGPVYNTVNPLTGTVATCLATPTSVSTSNIASGGFTLNWTASSGATSYQVDVATNSSFSPVIGTSPYMIAATLPTVTTTIGGLLASTTYYYRITAIGGNCNSIASATGTITTTGGTSITVSGFNYDVIANGTGTTVPLSTSIGTLGFDGVNGWDYYSNDFYVNHAGGTGYTGLPNSGSFNSANTAGIPYQLASYSANNCLWMPASVAGNTGTLTFTNPLYASTLYILGDVGSGGSCTAETVNLTITYTDNTTQTGTAQFGDWYGCTPIALGTIGRVGQTNNFDGASNGPNLYEKSVAITTYTKPIMSVKFTTTSGAGYLGIFGISARNGTLSASAGSLSFANTTQTCFSAAQTFSLSGSYLYPSGGSITVTAPTGFVVSSSSAGPYASTATISYAANTMTNAPVYVEFNPTLAGAQSGNLTFTGGTVNNPPTVAVSGVGTVAPTPQPISGTTNFCYGAVTSSTLGETVPGGTWSSTIPSVATVDNSGNLTIVGPGTTTIIYSLTTCSITNTVSALVTVDGVTVSVSPSGSVSACGSQTLSTTAAGTGYQWYNTSGIINGATDNTYTITNSGSVSATSIYSVQVTNSATGCTNMSPGTTVTVNPVPTATITTPGGITSICGTSIVLTANTNIGDTYQWSNSSGPINGATNATYTATITSTYSVNISQGGMGCNTTSATTAITINGVPTSSITPTAPPASCGSQLLTASTDIGNTYQWYNTSGIINGATDNTYNVVNSGSVQVINTYSVQVTSSATGCNSTSAGTMVTVNPIPTATISTPGNITSQCGGSILMTGNSTIGDTYQWSNSLGVINGATDATYAANSTGTYSVNISQVSTGCNTNSTTTAIAINAIPTASITPVSPPAACGNQLLTASTDIGNTYQWYNTSGIINGATDNTYNVVNSGSVQVTSSYSVQVTNSGTGCNSTSSGTSVVLNPTPTATITTPGNITADCSDIPMTANSTIGDTYQWYNSSGAINGATNAVYVATITGTYSVNIAKSGTGCNTNSASLMISIIPVPSSSVTPTGTVTACGSQLLTAGTDLGNTYQWYNSSGIINGATNITYTVVNVGSVSVSSVYSVQVSNSLTGCNSTSPGTSVTVNPIPTSTITTPGGIISQCGGSIVMTANSNIGNAYQWSNSSGIIIGATNVTYTASVSGTYAVNSKLISSGCNLSSANTIITINPIPTSSVTPTGTVTACGSQLLTAGTDIGNAYQWYNSSGIINGATGSTYTALNTGSVNVTSVYSVQVTNSTTGCNRTSVGTTVILNAIPTSSVTPSGTVTACGSQVLTAGTNIGNKYQWYNGSGAISGATNSTYAVVNSGSVMVTNVYSVTVTSSTTGCNSSSTGTTVILNPGPTSIVSPSGTVTACGSELLTALTNIGNAYQWYSSTSGAIGGATNSTYTVNNTGSVSVTNTYSVVVTNSSTTCNNTSPGTTVILNPIPTASVTPTGTVTACGSQVLTAGTNIGNRYQWYNGSGIINGATNNTYTASNTGSTTTTNTYSVTVTSSTTGCNSTSPVTTVILNAIPTSSVSPAGTVTACGSELLTAGTNIGNAYQWYSNTSGVIGGATNNTYTVNNTGSVSVTAIYSVMVTNEGTGCNLTSAGTTVIVNPIPTSSVTPTGTVTACGSQVLTAGSNIGNRYQWYNGSGIINGATNNTYTASNTGSTATTDVYSVKVSSSATGCNSTSIETTVILNAIPTSTFITAGGVTTNCGSLLLTGSSNIGDAYQWYKSTGVINGATNIVYTATVSGTYYIKTTNTATGCNSNSATQVITINPYPVVTVTPNGPTTFCAGSSITLTASNGYSYQWQNYGVNIAGATNGSYTSSQSGIFRVILFTPAPCIDTTTTTTITVNPMPSEVITANGPLAFCSGGSVVLTAQTGLATYQWVKPVNAIFGANTGNYTATTSGSYRVVMTTNNNCRDTSIVMVVDAEPLPNNTVSVSGATTFCEGGSVTLTAAAGMAGYQWHDSTSVIPGAAGQSYTTGASGSYKVFVSNGQCSDSSAAEVITNAAPDTSLTVSGSYRVVSGILTLCEGNTLNLSTGGGASSYQWDSSTVVIPGANTQAYTVTESGVYTLIMNSSFGCTDSVSRSIVVDTLPVPAIYEYGYGLQTTQAYASYQWYLNGAAIPGATNRGYLATTEGPYTVMVTDANGCSGMSASTTLNSLNVGTVTGIDISLYPNPASSVVYIQSPVKVKAVVYTIEGQEVASKEDAKDIDLSGLANGTYMVKLFGEDGTLLKVSKLVKSE